MLTKCPVDKQRLLHGSAEILFNIMPPCNTLIIISTKYTSFQEISRNRRKLSQEVLERFSILESFSYVMLSF